MSISCKGVFVNIFQKQHAHVQEVHRLILSTMDQWRRQIANAPLVLHWGSKLILGNMNGLSNYN